MNNETEQHALLGTYIIEYIEVNAYPLHKPLTNRMICSLKRPRNVFSCEMAVYINWSKYKFIQNYN